MLEERRRKDQKGCKFTADELEHGAIEICKATHGKYTTAGGKKRPAAGGLTKVQYVAHLSPAAKALLCGARGLSSRVPGTDETRVQMRYETNAMRVFYGLQIFVTISPDET